MWDVGIGFRVWDWATGFWAGLYSGGGLGLYGGGGGGLYGVCGGGRGFGLKVGLSDDGGGRWGIVYGGWL